MPKEFLEKVKTTENPNMMCPYVFEKEEMTFFYVEYVLSVFEQTGL